jgi:hypothetical protein
VSFTKLCVFGRHFERFNPVLERLVVHFQRGMPFFRRCSAAGHRHGVFGFGRSPEFGLYPDPEFQLFERCEIFRKSAFDPDLPTRFRLRARKRAGRSALTANGSDFGDRKSFRERVGKRHRAGFPIHFRVADIGRGRDHHAFAFERKVRRR